MIIIGQVSKLEKIESTFEVVAHSDNFVQEKEISYANYPDDEIFVIDSRERHKLKKVSYGLVPSWSSTKKLFFEAPVDGFKGSAETLKFKILQEPAFRKSIRESRCIVPVDYFIISENDISSLFFCPTRPFALAGLVDTWEPTIKDEVYTGAAILTLPAEGIFRTIGFKRQPLILEDKYYKYWLKDISLTEVTGIINYYPDKEINGFFVNPQLLSGKETGKNVISAQSDFYKEHTKVKASWKSKNRFRRGATHNQEQEQRTWRNSN